MTGSDRPGPSDPDDRETTARGDDQTLTDPVLIRRAKVARLNRLALVVGAGCYLLATALFLVANATRFSPLLGAMLTVLLIAGSLLLAPAIVFHYAIRAADRADRDDSW